MDQQQLAAILGGAAVHVLHPLMAKDARGLVSQGGGQKGGGLVSHGQLRELGSRGPIKGMDAALAELDGPVRQPLQGSGIGVGHNNLLAAGSDCGRTETGAAPGFLS